MSSIIVRVSGDASTDVQYFEELASSLRTELNAIKPDLEVKAVKEIKEPPPDGALGLGNVIVFVIELVADDPLKAYLYAEKVYKVGAAIFGIVRKKAKDKSPSLEIETDEGQAVMSKDSVDSISDLRPEADEPNYDNDDNESQTK